MFQALLEIMEPEINKIKEKVKEEVTILLDHGKMYASCLLNYLFV